jgi:hypothetical protein
MSLMGTITRDRTKKPLMHQEDSSLKKAMKAVTKLGRANRPQMPKPMRRAEGI